MHVWHRFHVCPLLVDVVHSQPLLNYPEGGVTSTGLGLRRLAKVGASKSHTLSHTRPHRRPFISAPPSNDCVPVFGSKMGLRELNLPKAGGQIQPLWSTMARVVAIPSSRFKRRQPRLGLKISSFLLAPSYFFRPIKILFFFSYTWKLIPIFSFSHSEDFILKSLTSRCLLH